MSFVPETAEIITGNEALRRIGCSELCDPMHEDRLVAWLGHPAAFACGDTKPAGRNDDGSYTYARRFNRSFCAGSVLFSFQCVSTTSSRRFYLAHSLVVSIDTEKHGHARDLFLHAAVSA